MRREALKTVVSNSLAEEKRVLRREMRRRLRAMSEETRAEQSRLLVDQIRAATEYRNAGRIALFTPLPDEPDIFALAADSLQSGKAVFLPRYNEATHRYEFVRLLDPETDLSLGNFGVLEPLSSLATIGGKPLDFVLVPGLAFDGSGARLGRGKGFYDRLLMRESAFKAGVCFDFQRVDGLPTERHDVVLDHLYSLDAIE